MTNNPLDIVQPQTPARPNSQATAVEQARAEAEVKAAVVVAQQCPRDVDLALRMIEDACSQPALASRAFFAYPRAGQTVTGASIHLAREVARCWGNIDYGIRELRRDDEGGESEMLAYAWDQQTNVRSSSSFIVPHARWDSKRKTRNPLEDPRDVYENNANNGARRVREAIFSVVPKWFSEHAIERCRATNEHGGGKPLAIRIQEALAGFDRALVTRDQLEAHIGKPTAQWTGDDVARLGVLFSSLQRGEITRAEAFAETANRPPQIPVVDAAQVATRAPEPTPTETPAEAPAEEPAAEAPAEPQQAAVRRPSAAVRRVLGLLHGAGIESVNAFLTKAVGHTITNSADLTDDEANEIRDSFDALLEDWVKG